MDFQVISKIRPPAIQILEWAMRFPVPLRRSGNVFGSLLLGTLLFSCSANSVPGQPDSGNRDVNLYADNTEFTDPAVSIVNFAALERGEIVQIIPVWDFYWKRLLNPDELENTSPDVRTAGMKIWKKLGYESQGFATYRTTLEVPRNTPIAFKISQQLTSVNLFLDGRLAARDGNPGSNAEETIPGRSNLIAEHTSKTGTVEIVMQIANFHSFRGGARGHIEVGPVESVRDARSLQEALELLASGFLLSIGLYHLILFAMQRRQWVFLVFGLTCLSFALRIPLLGEKTVDLLWPDLAWEIQYRFNMGLNIVTPPLLILFFHLLFPAALNRKLLYAFLGICGLFSLSIFLDTVNLGRTMFAYYLVAAGPALLMGFYMALVYGIRQKGSGRTMAFGMGVVSILGVMAIYQNWYTRDYAGQLAMLAFISFGFFQSIGVAQRFKESVDMEKALSTSLRRSREALSHQRQSLENDLHDSLGSKLVDLKLQLGSGRLEPHKIQNRVDDIYSMFRGQLLFMEDLEYAAADPVAGLQLSLLRRYSGVGRELRFRLSPEHSENIRILLLDDAFRMDFLQLCRELCTNDLKYGRGESIWRVSVDSEASLILRQMNRIGSSSIFREEESSSDVERVALHARKRVQSMKGSISIAIRGKCFTALIRIPQGHDQNPLNRGAWKGSSR
ncbi:MAG TPA: hypothetical protein DEA96_18760 [Leptospiraceae bacterium]|nr:hypothetical protein [Spirochaetaceae bacterium]HBS07020.1 hypothetical protein [Leptospiraceae bacterium]|tara:strand:- start:908 stop:2929 length:2022 start_codon:yes stop_codon:yes gene_type:complete